jgi:hypothetical protein
MKKKNEIIPLLITLPVLIAFSAALLSFQVFVGVKVLHWMGVL